MKHATYFFAIAALFVTAASAFAQSKTTRALYSAVALPSSPAEPDTTAPNAAAPITTRLSTITLDEPATPESFATVRIAGEAVYRGMIPVAAAGVAVAAVQRCLAEIRAHGWPYEHAPANAHEQVEIHVAWPHLHAHLALVAAAQAGGGRGVGAAAGIRASTEFSHDSAPRFGLLVRMKKQPTRRERMLLPVEAKPATRVFFSKRSLMLHHTLVRQQ